MQHDEKDGCNGWDERDGHYGCYNHYGRHRCYGTATDALRMMRGGSFKGCGMQRKDGVRGQCCVHGFARTDAARRPQADEGQKKGLGGYLLSRVSAVPSA